MVMQRSRGSFGRTCSVAALVLLIAGPLATRAGLPVVVGLALFALSALLAALGVVAALVRGIRSREWARGAAGIALGLAVLAVPAFQMARAGGAPPIHDITTDLVEPPVFVAALPLRLNAANPAEYGGPDVAAQQRRAFPDIQPIALEAPVTQVAERARAIALALGWEVVAFVPAEGRVEAVDTTFWFGFKDDVVIRLRPTPTGTRVDLRSTSRVGLGDAGTNARRVRAFLAALKAS